MAVGLGPSRHLAEGHRYRDAEVPWGGGEEGQGPMTWRQVVGGPQMGVGAVGVGLTWAVHRQAETDPFRQPRREEAARELTQSEKKVRITNKSRSRMFLVLVTSIEARPFKVPFYKASHSKGIKKRALHVHQRKQNISSESF